MAFLGRIFAPPKENVRSAAPLGTVVLINRVQGTANHHEHTENRLQLIPEPSLDPADPLNFPVWRKVTILLCMSLYAFTANVSSAILSSALPALVTAFAVFKPDGPPQGLVSFSSLTHLTAVSVLMLGVSNVFWVPLGNTFGRRPIMLLALLVLVGASIWCGKAGSFHSLLAARVVQGIGGGPADTLAPNVVGQVFFLHQRGRAMGIYTVFLAAGSLVGGLVGGYVTSSLGWRWTGYIPAIMSGVLFVLFFLFVPETLFDRQAALSVSRPMMSFKVGEVSSEKNVVSHVEAQKAPTIQPYTFSMALKLGIYRPGLLKRFFTPYLTLLLPGTWMVMLHYAGLIGLIVTISIVGPQYLSVPPYHWGANAGLINVGGLIGTLLGALYTYFSADWWTKHAAQKENHGFAEPEARLPLMIPSLVIAFSGALAFGLSAQAHTATSWVGLEFGMGMVAFGLMQAPSIGFNYLIEAYGGWSSDCFLMVVCLRAIVSFAWTFFVGSWTTEAGFAVPFGIFALLMGLFGLTTVFVWLLGKRFRIVQHDLIKRKFYVEE